MNTADSNGPILDGVMYPCIKCAFARCINENMNTWFIKFTIMLPVVDDVPLPQSLNPEERARRRAKSKNGINPHEVSRLNGKPTLSSKKCSKTCANYI